MIYNIPDHHHSPVSTLVVTKTITVVETIVDGKIVESSKTVDIDVHSDDD